jgi:hypothetical protein
LLEVTLLLRQLNEEEEEEEASPAVVSGDLGDVSLADTHESKGAARNKRGRKAAFILFQKNSCVY